MSSEEHCIDLLNAIQLAGDATSVKLSKLEQLREILLKRSPQLLTKIAPDVFAFMLEPSAKIRKFLLQFSGEVFQQDKTFAASFITLLHYFKSDTSENVMKSILAELSKNYGRLVLAVSIMKQGVSNSFDPVEIWKKLQELASFCVEEILASSKPDVMRIGALRVAESILCFGLKQNAVSQDPRLARSRQAKGGGAGNSGISEIALHHPFIDRSDLETRADEMFTKFAMYALRCGPQNHPFSPMLMCALGQSIAKISESRDEHRSEGARALRVIINGKNSKLNEMNHQQKTELAKVVASLLKSFKAGDTNPEIDKLREALKMLEESLSGGGDGGKDMDIVIESSEDIPLAEVDDEIGRELSEVPIDMPLKRHRSVDKTESNLEAPEAIQIGSSQIDHASGKAETILSTELGLFSEFSADSRMVALQAFESPLLSRQYRTFDGSNLFDTCASVDLSCVDVSNTAYSDVAFIYLKRLLESFSDMKDVGSSMLIAHLKLSLRTALAMSKIDMFENKPMSKVTIIISTPNPLEGLPVTVEIPRPLWLYLSFTLALDVSKGPNDVATAQERLLLELISELHRRGGPSPLYDNVILIIVSRLLQKTQLRPLAKPFILSLPKIPDELTCLLKLVSETGTRSVINKKRDSSDQSSEFKDVGTRMISVQFLRNIAVGLDPSAAQSALYHLLWNTVSEDFEIRSKVTSIIKELVPMGNSNVPVLIDFAIQSALSVSGLVSTVVVSGAVETNNLSPETPVTVVEALRRYDGGSRFQSKFSLIPDDFQFIESSVRRHLHLIFQLCMEIPMLLSFLVDLYSTVNEKIANEQKSDTEGSVHSLLAKVATGKEKNYSCMSFVLYSEFSIIFSVLVRQWSSSTLFRCVKNLNVHGRSMVVLALDLLQGDINSGNNAPEDLMTEVRAFLSEDSTQFPPHGDLRILAQVVSGLSKDELLQILPSILVTYLDKPKPSDDDNVSVKKLLLRTHRTRAPILSKTELLVFLHNLHDEYCTKADTETERTGFMNEKTIKDCIEFCIENKGDFKGFGDAIKESISLMIADESRQIPRAIMWTAIRSTHTYKDETKKFVLSTLMPKLMQIKIWLKSKSLWDGVALGVKQLASNRDSEPTLRAVLSLPGPQLKSLMAVATNVKTLLTTLIKSLSKSEYFEVVSGKWLYGENYSEYVGIDGSLAMDHDREKSDILKELQK